MDFVAYFRVSTTEQGRSGLGIDAQRRTVLDYVKGNLIAEYVETESGAGRLDQRPQLKLAIEHARRSNAKLIAARLDRISRSVSAIFKLRDSGVAFIACDLPESANTLTIGVIAALAQYERELISTRTKAGLAEAKAKGRKLGNPELLQAYRQEAIRKAAEKRREDALNNPNNRIATELALAYKSNGLGLSAIARKLNTIGLTTRRGCQFNATAIRRLLTRNRKETIR